MADRPLFIRLNLPSGLEEALESLAREVLRQKPQNIYEFAADHFEELVKKRNESEGVTSDDIFGIHTELKLPSSKIQSHLALGDEDNTELESVSGRNSAVDDAIDIDLDDPERITQSWKVSVGGTLL